MMKRSKRDPTPLLSGILLNHKGEECCSVCEQSASYPGSWPFIDRGDGKQDVGFLNCPECGSKHVCGDCYHEGDCCAKARGEDVFCF